MARLSDTEAIARRPCRRDPRAIVASKDWMASECVEEATARPNPGHFQKRTSAGPEGLAGACAELDKK